MHLFSNGAQRKKDRTEAALKLGGQNKMEKKGSRERHTYTSQVETGTIG